MNDCRLRMNPERRRILASLAVALVGVVVTLGDAGAEQLKPFPEHWGEVPMIQTRDYVEWPDGYGQGSGTVAKWIADHIAQDKVAVEPAAEVLYAADFSTVKAGELPEDFMVLNGEFAVREADGRKVLELPGAPLDSFAIMFGPARPENTGVAARILGTSQGRRYPAFAVGLNGLGGYRLKVASAKRSLELFRGSEESGELVASSPLSWTSGQWTHLRLQVRRVGTDEWRVEGKAWMDGSVEPTKWMVSYVEKQKPLPGRAYVAASPFSGTPLRFDGLVVTQVLD